MHAHSENWKHQDKVANADLNLGGIELFKIISEALKQCVQSVQI